jgi:hypothetical protein
MNKLFLLFTFILLQLSLFGQEFLDGNHTFSSKKESYLTLKDGTEVTGFIDDIDRKKGLIEEITIKNKDGKKLKYTPDQIDHMYICPSGFDKFASGYSKLYDATKWEDDKSLNQQHLKAGYSLFESSEVMIKKSKKILLMQLLNPAYSSKIRVYFDPFASETSSVGIGGFTVAGGDAKSYYVKKGNNVAFKLEKKNYEEEEKNMYGDCDNYISKITEKGKMKWTDLNKHIFSYTNECK